MPGVRCSRRRCQPWIWRSSSTTSGRGPTRLISPRSTLISCGSSSSDGAAQEPADARHARVGVDLEEAVAPRWARAARALRASASTTIERNLRIWKWRPSRPTRVCRNRTGPGESSRIASAIAASSGASRTSEHGRADAVEARLTACARRESPKRRTPEQRHAAEVVERDRRADDVEHLRQEADLHAQRLGGLDRLVDGLRRRAVARDHDPVDVQVADGASAGRARRPPRGRPRGGRRPVACCPRAAPSRCATSAAGSRGGPPGALADEQAALRRAQPPRHGPACEPQQDRQPGQSRQRRAPCPVHPARSRATRSVPGR